MDFESKDSKDFKILYEWLQIARKPAQKLRNDIKMMMDLIQIPVSAQEVEFLMTVMDPSSEKGKLHEHDFLSCFIVAEEEKKPKEKEIVSAFKSLANNSDTIKIETLRGVLTDEGLDEFAVEMVLKQIGDWELDDGEFDYRKFAASCV